MRFVWHEIGELPGCGLPVIVKTNMVSYHVGVYNGEQWWLRTGKRYSEVEKVISGNEKITAWAYIGGES